MGLASCSMLRRELLVQCNINIIGLVCQGLGYYTAWPHRHGSPPFGGDPRSKKSHRDRKYLVQIVLGHAENLGVGAGLGVGEVYVANQ